MIKPLLRFSTSNHFIKNIDLSSDADTDRDADAVKN